MLSRRQAVITFGGLAATTALALTGCAPSVGGGTSGGGTKKATQAEIDKEMAEVRDGVAKFRAIPQLTVGVNYRF